MTNLLHIATLNCEGIKRSRDYINNYLHCSSCDILCIQETWYLHENIDFFSTISSKFLYIAKSGVDSGACILHSRPKGGVGIVYKKSLSDKIIHFSSHNRRVSGIHINFISIFSCLLLSVYLPCDNYSTVYVNHEYTECIDYIESLYNAANCSAFLCCGYYNCSLDRSNEQTEFLKEFIFRNNFALSWDHSLSKKDFTYVNMSLNQIQCPHRAFI